mmetsp:Transcript_24833/g.33912  ORF Transcript_24833/g.33912 Transcript_24833/m.33912 type:complete len:140 (+) Transcript_24833:471-890(+)
MYCGEDANVEQQNNQALKEYFERINEVDATVNPKINDYMCRTSACPCSTRIEDAADKWEAIDLNIKSNNGYYYSANSDTVAFSQNYDCLVNNGYISDSSTTTEYGLKTINFLETQFGCAGFCSSPYFYVYLDNAEYGPP